MGFVKLAPPIHREERQQCDSCLKKLHVHQQRVQRLWAACLAAGFRLPHSLSLSLATDVHTRFEEILMQQDRSVTHSDTWKKTHALVNRMSVAAADKAGWTTLRSEALVHFGSWHIRNISCQNEWAEGILKLEWKWERQRVKERERRIQNTAQQ